MSPAIIISPFSLCLSLEVWDKIKSIFFVCLFLSFFMTMVPLCYVSFLCAARVNIELTRYGGSVWECVRTVHTLTWLFTILNVCMCVCEFRALLQPCRRACIHTHAPVTPNTQACVSVCLCEHCATAHCFVHSINHIFIEVFNGL